MDKFDIRPLRDTDQTWLPDFFITQWGSTRQVVRGTIFIPHELSGFVATVDSDVVGVVTYRFLDETTGEVATLNSLCEGVGVGGALIHSVIAAMRAHGRRRLVVVTTNDNLHALRFYQKRGFVLAELRTNALAAARQIKPEIPLFGNDNIPLRDEIELALNLV
jgi:DNA-3-methyladenine glycosylase I